MIARTPSDVPEVLAEAGRRVRRDRLFAAGFVSYEAAPAFDDAYATHPASTLPLICFGLFGEPERTAELQLSRNASWHFPGWRFDVPRERYLENIGKIKRQIEAGNTYQVNYTVRQRAEGVDDPWDLFLATATDAPYAAFVDCTDHAIVSASPELFFELSGDRIVCKPMKGTAARGMTMREDRENRRKLHESAKDRAENVMIADMVRNDLGRVALPGSVRASALCEVEKYRTVWQMTSTVTASTTSAVEEIFHALFPSASVTGAPKVSSMNVIAALEDSPRGIYTGAIGYIAPERKARFNVAIRTAVITRSGTGTYGVGGGIVWDSDPDDEYQECLDKARVFARPGPPANFRLLETMSWTQEDGFFLLQEHLDRLADSAEYFDFAFDRARIESRLTDLARNFEIAAGQRVRLLLRQDGDAEIETKAISAGDSREFRLALAASPVDSRDPFLYHKTTHRDVYEKALLDAGDCDDVLLWNTDGNVTESTIGNVVVRLADRLVTPPVECGLLAGTFRRKLLRDGIIQEKPIAITDLPTADAIYLVNSVRRWIPSRLSSGTVTIDPE